MSFRIVLASLDDLSVVLSILRDASQWLATLGTDQWQYPPNAEKVRQSIEAGTLYLLVDDRTNISIGTITITEKADPDFWRQEDDPSSALYINRMAVRQDYAGRSLGAEMLEWATQEAKARGKTWLRLDAWRTNEALHNYYRAQGFDLVRTEKQPHRRSGTLFQRRVE